MAEDSIKYNIFSNSLRAVAHGNCVPLSAITDDYIISTFNGTAWSEYLRLTNAGGLKLSGLSTGNVTSDSGGTLSSSRGQLYAVNTNTAASAGNIGEYKESDIPIGSAVSLTSGVTKSVTSIVLDPGEWLVFGTASVEVGTTFNYSIVSISSTNNTLDTSKQNRFSQLDGRGVLPNVEPTCVVGPARFLVPTATTLTVYLVVRAGFTGSSNAYGNISAYRTH